jgi:hypothetical protein
LDQHPNPALMQFQPGFMNGFFGSQLERFGNRTPGAGGNALGALQDDAGSESLEEQRVRADAARAKACADGAANVARGDGLAAGGNVLALENASTEEDDGLAHLEAMELAQAAAAKQKADAHLAAKLCKAAGKAKATGAKRPAAKPAGGAKAFWDVGDDAAGAEADAEVEEDAAEEPAKPVLKKPAACRAVGPPPAKVAKLAVVAAVVPKPPPKAWPKAKGPAAKAKGVAPKPAAVATPAAAKTVMHGISFADLLLPAKAKAAVSRGAFTSRAYDTTGSRARSKFGKEDPRVSECRKAAYTAAVAVYERIVPNAD